MAKREGGDPVVVADTVAGPTAPAAVVSGGLGFTVEEATAALMEHLPEPVQRFLRDMEQQEGTPPHEYVLSYIIRHYENGEMSFRMGEHALPPPRRVGMPGPAGFTPQPCAYCGAAFTPDHLGQLYCPEPDSDGPDADIVPCGRLAVLEKIHQAPRYQGASEEHMKRRKQLVVARSLGQMSPVQ